MVEVDDVRGVGEATSSPLSLTNVDRVAGTADLLFTADGANDWNLLAGGTRFASGQLFAKTTFVPEPSTAALMTLGLVGLAARRRRP